MCMCVCVCGGACVRAYVRACVSVCVRGRVCTPCECIYVWACAGARLCVCVRAFQYV